MSKDTLDMTKAENIVAAFVAVQQNEKILEDRIESMRQQVESALSDLKFQLEIFARMTEKLLMTDTEDRSVQKVTVEEYRLLADKCKKDFLHDLKNKISKLEETT